MRRIGPFTVSPVGLGCMNLSHAYGVPPSPEVGATLLHHAREIGYNLIDTAALYGFGKNETLIGETLPNTRDDYVLASKGGMAANDEGKRAIDGRPEVLRKNLEQSLKNLRADAIDLYYLHRWDKKLPIEDQVGALADFKREGKIRAIGLSEISVPTLLKATKIAKIDAVQSEYSLWSRNPDVATAHGTMLDVTYNLGIAFVAFSPLGRGFLPGTLHSNEFVQGDIRRPMPRFIGENWEHNLSLLSSFALIAKETGRSMAELSIAWLLHRAPHVIALPGSTSAEHISENWRGQFIALSAETIGKLESLFAKGAVHGNRYPAAVQAEIDTEEEG